MVPAGAMDPSQTGQQVFILAGCTFTGLVGDETIKLCAIETLRKDGVGSGPLGFCSIIGPCRSRFLIWLRLCHAEQFRFADRHGP
jgi:hypothetical protein